MTSPIASSTNTARPASPGAGHHAIVIGGSIAGSLAARVLADHFERVTILERDHLPDGPLPRGGAPQARHTHVLLVRGKQLLEGLFPGLEAELVAAGAPVIDVSGDILWFTRGAGGPARIRGSRPTSAAAICWNGACGTTSGPCPMCSF